MEVFPPKIVGVSHWSPIFPDGKKTPGDQINGTPPYFIHGKIDGEDLNKTNPLIHKSHGNSWRSSMEIHGNSPDLSEGFPGLRRLDLRALLRLPWRHPPGPGARGGAGGPTAAHAEPLGVRGLCGGGMGWDLGISHGKTMGKPMGNPMTPKSDFCWGKGKEQVWQRVFCLKDLRW